MKSVLAMLGLTCCLGCPQLWAEVARVEVMSRGIVAEGMEFGLAGSYEWLSGRIHFEVDPAHSSNKIICDIERAPFNESGRVEFSSDFYLLKPMSPGRSNGTVLYEVSNRGGKGLLRFFNFAASSLDPKTAEQMGDGFLLKQGYTLLWVGWQFDPPQREGLIRLLTPIATDEGRPIKGLVRSDFVPTEKEYSHSLADRNHQPYLVADPEHPANVLTVRDSVEGERRVIPRSEWSFARFEGGEVHPDAGSVYREAGFEPNKIYEVVYQSSNPPLVGLGPAAIRDSISWFKYGATETVGIPKGSIQHAIGFGISQSGRFLRTFLYYGFNVDENRRKVFDGVVAHVAGAGRGSFNHRFAQPSRDGHPYLNFFYPTDIFPFTDVELTDPETGLSDGLLTHAGTPKELQPKIFYTNSSYEYWGRAASLIHTSIDGKRDVDLLPNVRIYLLAGGQHGPAPFPPKRTIGQQLSNPNEYRWIMRALLVAMERWITDDRTPPESRYPKVQDGTLVPPEKLNFPRIPGVVYLPTTHRAYRADYGPRFRTEGIVSVEPPRLGASFPILVPQVDRDGNELAGIMMPEVAVPLATYTGWNLFNAESGPTNVLSSMQGSYIPFPTTKEQGERAGDPRESVNQRYPSLEHYLGLISKAGLELFDQGFLRAEDLAEVTRAAERHWRSRK